MSFQVITIKTVKIPVVEESDNPIFEPVSNQELQDRIQASINEFKVPITLQEILEWTETSRTVDCRLYDHEICNIDVDKFFDLYADCLRLATRTSNWKLILCLWQGYYHHDRNCPDFSLIFEMAQFSDVRTFLLGLDGILNWLTLNGQEEFTYEQLHKLAQLNPHCGRNECLTSTGCQVIDLIGRLMEDPDFEIDEEASDDDEFYDRVEKKTKELMQEFGMLEDYKHIKKTHYDGYK
jgi:hypothetical protein